MDNATLNQLRFFFQTGTEILEYLIAVKRIFSYLSVHVMSMLKYLNIQIFSYISDMIQFLLVSRLKRELVNVLIIVCMNLQRSHVEGCLKRNGEEDASQELWEVCDQQEIQ